MNSSYSASGVNISEGDLFVEKIKPLIKKTFSGRVLGGIGNFGAFFKVPKGKFKNPVFVASTDGVGTKLKVAIAAGKNDTIGEDLVNHCVNDIAVLGAEPMFFLDYLAFGKLSSPLAYDIVKGIVRGCLNNGCSLIGGETAEMPGLYSGRDYDLAGTIVGMADRKKLVDKKNVRTGDVLIGLSSNGLHTNGYSLVRNVLLKKYALNRRIDELGCKLADELLRVHRSYLKAIRGLLKRFRIHSISHITGGGILGNTRRVTPSKLRLNIDWGSWERPPIFGLIKKTGNISEHEMRKVFNLGIGLVILCSKNDAGKIAGYLKRTGEKSYIIGEVSA